MYPDIDRITDRMLGGDGPRNIEPRSAILPSVEAVKEIMREIAELMFPGFYTSGGVARESLRHRIAAGVDIIYRRVAEQILRCMEFDGTPCAQELARMKASDFVNRLPEVRDLLDSDVHAAYDGDPAAKSMSETIFCYPSIRIMTDHRIAHELYRLGVPLLPRMISEMAHSRTGIDIHPGASIGPEFFIDHGTGVVIGETAIIGARCRLYQGVTLGALSFPKDANGNPIKGLPRHPVLEDCVTVYGGATILGRVTIGRGSMIGGNVWITTDVPPYSKVVQQRSTSATSSEAMFGKSEG